MLQSHQCVFSRKHGYTPISYLFFKVKLSLKLSFVFVVKTGIKSNN